MPKSIISASSLLFILLTACQKQNDKAIIQSLEESLKNSNIQITHFTTTQLKALEEKTIDYSSRERAKVWFPIAQKIVAVSQKAINFVEEKKKKKNLTQTDIDEIYQYVSQFNRDILSADPEIDTVAKYSISFIPKYPLSLYSDVSGTKKILYAQLPIHSQKAILNSYENEVINIQNKTISYCNLKVSNDLICTFDFDHPLIEQNGKILQPGDVLEIKAGIGSFSRAALPKININNENINLNEEGFSLYRMKVPDKPGEYTVPVLLKYFDRISEKELSRIVDVEYTVAKPCKE